MVRIMGLDPGLNATGWGVIELNGNKIHYIASGTVTTKASAPLPDRLNKLYEGLTTPLKLYQPDQAAIEETFVNKNAASSLKLGHARGAIMVTVSLFDIPLAEYAATQVKKAIVGVGRAEKTQVQMMVKQLVPNAQFDSADAADALAVALCHGLTAQTNAYWDA